MQCTEKRAGESRRLSMCKNESGKGPPEDRVISCLEDLQPEHLG